MPHKTDSPKVYVPPPVIYAAYFVAAIFIQDILPLDNGFFHSPASKILGAALVLISIFIGFAALGIFIKTKNTVVTVKPASSLQTTGIYSKSRNPMYLGLLVFYAGLSCLIGNWWNLIFLPLLILTIQAYVIHREERYLHRRFGQAYSNYKHDVRRWL